MELVQMTTELAALAGQLGGEVIPPPKEVQDALDTAKFWMYVIAGGLAVIAFILIGIRMFFISHHGDARGVITSLGWAIGGCIVVASAVALATMFVPSGA